jgi:hypothetical protein
MRPSLCVGPSEGPTPPATGLRRHSRLRPTRLLCALLVGVWSCQTGGTDAPVAPERSGGSGPGGSGAAGAGGRGGAGAGTGGSSAGAGATGGSSSAGAGGSAGGATGGAPAGGTGGTPPLTDGPAPAPEVGPSVMPGMELVVAAGDLDRDHTPVTFMLAAGSARSYVLTDAMGARLPLQVDEQGRASFVLPALKAGSEARFGIAAADAAPAAAVKAARGADGVDVAVGDKQVFHYQMQGKLPGGVGDAFLRGGYLHPILTPTGTLVTDDYPGDHRHHHGIWSAWAHTVFEGRDIDFWNMGGRSAKVDFESLVRTWEGPVHGGLHAKQVHSSLAGGAKPALREDWVLTAYQTHEGAAPYFLFDIDSTQEAASASPVMLQQYIYGGFGLRGNRQWGAGVQFLTSEGRTRANGDGTTMRWTHMGGQVDGKPAGYAILGHPENFRAPQPVRLNPTDPFFSVAPVRMSGFNIMQGKPYISRYRIVVSDGAPDKALLDRLWNDYAKPPTVTVR